MIQMAKATASQVETGASRLLCRAHLKNQRRCNDEPVDFDPVPDPGLRTAELVPRVRPLRPAGAGAGALRHRAYRARLT
jgi:hypothetical protein